MPRLIPSRKFLDDVESWRPDPVRGKKLAKALHLLEMNPLHPGLHLERITNDPSAWAIRIDQRYRLSFDPTGYLQAGNPNWSEPLILLRVLDHDNLFRRPRQ